MKIEFEEIYSYVVSDILSHLKNCEILRRKFKAITFPERSTEFKFHTDKANFLVEIDENGKIHSISYIYEDYLIADNIFKAKHNIDDTWILYYDEFDHVKELYEKISLTLKKESYD